jgi:hypothetical protein
VNPRLAIPVAVLLAVCAAGCSSVGPVVSTATALAGREGVALAASPAGIGSAVTLPDAAVHGSLRVTLAGVVDPAPYAGSALPYTGDRFVAVAIRIVDAGTVAYRGVPTADLTAWDGAGEGFGADVSVRPPGGFTAGAVTLLPGAGVSGVEFFDVPIGDSLATVRWALNDGRGGGAARWTVG